MMVVLVVVVVLLLVLPAIVRGQSEQIAGGDGIRPKNYLWFTSVENAGGGFVCSGSLVGRRFVLTAEHCIRNRSFSALRVRVSYYCPEVDNCGKRDFATIGVDAVWPPGTPGDDFALLQLTDSPAIPKGVIPAVPDVLGGNSFSKSHLKQVSKRKETMFLVGAGREDRVGDVTPTVRKLKVQYMKRKTCESRISNQELLSDSDFCSRGINGRPCNGDSGAALVVRGRKRNKLKGRDVVVAVHSFGPDDCANPDNPLPLGHFAVWRASDRILQAICRGAFPEDWCPENAETPPLSLQPTHSPTQKPSPALSHPPTVAPSPKPTHFPTKRPSPVPTQAPTPFVPRIPSNVQVSQFRTLSTSVTKVDFNPDGSRLASGGWCDNQVKVWNPIATFNPLLVTYQGHCCCVWTAVFHPNGQLLASGDDSGFIRIWDTRSNTNLITLRHGASSIETLAWSPDGSLLASTSDDGSAQVYRSDTYQVVQVLNHPDNVDAVMFHPTQPQMATGCKDGNLRLWSTFTWQLQATLRGHSDNIEGLAYSPNGAWIATASDDATVRIWNVATQRSVQTLRGHVSFVNSVDWSPDGQFVVSGSSDANVRIWNANEGGPARLVLNGGSDWIRSVVWSPNGRHIAAGSDDGNIRIWLVDGV